MLAAHSAGEENQPFRQLVCLLVLSVGAASATTAVCTWLVGDILKNVSVACGMVGALFTEVRTVFCAMHQKLRDGLLAMRSRAVKEFCSTLLYTAERGTNLAFE